jgi:monoamine oxidase
MEYVNYKPQGSPVQRIDDVKQYNAKLAEVAEKLFSINGMTPREMMPYPYDPSRTQPWMEFDHMSVQDRLDQLDVPAREKDLFAAHTNSFGSGPASEIAYTDALRWFALGGYSFPTMYDAAASFKLGNGGMTGLARHILNQYTGDRILGKVVSSLDQTKGSQVTVSCADGSTYRARRVICTIPLNCLSEIHFQPPLPLQQQNAIRDGHINSGEKYHFVTDGYQGNWFANTSDAGGSDFLFGLKDHNGEALSGE